MGGNLSEHAVTPISAEDVEENLLYFFRNIWLMHSYKYIVFVARRCFNLNEAFMRAWHARKGYVPKNIDSFMSDMGLLLQAEDLAKYYTAHKAFPKILICDDLIFYGRGLIRLLYQLELLIAEHLDGTDGDSRYEIHRELIRAVDIYVFAENRNKIILSEDYQKKIRVATTRMYPSELRVLSHYIAEYLAESDVPYTTYVFSHEMELPIRNDDWQTVNWTYNNHQTCAMFQGEKNCIRTVRYHEHPKKKNRDEHAEEKAQKIPVISFPMIVDMNTDELNKICSGISGLLGRQKFEYPIHKILNNHQELLMKLRGQLITFIYSVISLYEFSPQTKFELPDNDGINDLNKIASNFGPRGAVVNEFTEFVKYLLNPEQENLRAEIKSLFQHTGSGRLHTFKPGELEVREEDKEKIIRATEDIAYDADIQGEVEAYQVCKSDRWFYPIRMFEDRIDPQIFLHQLSYITRLSEEEYRGAFLTSILALMDNGYLALKMATDKEIGENKSVLKAGEPSLHIMPQRYKAVMPALERIEQSQWRFKISKKDAVELFLEQLPVDTLPEETRSDLEELQTKRDEICDSVYESGQTFTGWNASLELIEHEYDDAMIRAQKMCKGLAEKFIEQNAVI